MDILSLQAQLLQKESSVIEGKNILVLHCYEPEVFNLLSEQLPDANFTFFNFDFDADLVLKNALDKKAHTVFGSWYITKKLHDTVILFLPKSENLIHMTLAMISGSLEPEGYLYVVGHKTEGIKSQPANIEESIGPVIFSESARHSTLYKAQFIKGPHQKKNLHDWQQNYIATISGHELSVATLPGVFSYGKLDAGTELLLNNMDLKGVKTVLDWGCGSGIIGAYLKTSVPSIAVDFADNSAVALESTRLTCKLNNLEASEILPTHVFSGVPNSYDLIVSNPPFHKGVKTEYSVVEMFLSQSRHHLNSGGGLQLVANSFLKYKPLIESQFGNCVVVSQTPAYKVYKAFKQ